MSQTRTPSDLPPDDPVAQAAEYALGLLPEDERPAFEARLATDRDLQVEVAAWQEHLADLALADVTEVAPPPQLGKRLEALLFKTEEPSIWRSLWPYALGGVAAALLLWVTMATDLLLPDDGVAPTLQAELAPTPDGEGLLLTAQVDTETGQVQVIRAAGAPPQGRVLELWLIAGDAAPVSLGLLDADASTVLVLPRDLLASLSGATLAISDEPPGGSPTGAPTGAVRAAGTLTSS